ncbi:PIR protein [Plasmodium ovale]|uniref:PIR protein n=1 Tax=Plasmodium ovale TaxID=36330 RepID=A0A1C3KGV8_PLAOA|nr:PIR protein [Plasmodium ovale]
MSEQDKDPFFKKYEENYPFLLSLPLYTIYSYFYASYMDIYELQSSCEYQINNEIEHASEIRQVCKATQTYFSELPSFIDTHSSVDITKGCEYLGYWIYDKIKHIKGARDNVRNLYGAIDTFKLDHRLKGNCSNIKDFNISEDKFEVKKELFFHSENLFWIEKEYDPTHDTDKSLYEKYLDECSKYYKGIFLNNFCKNDKEYESELRDFKDKFNSTKNYLKDLGIEIALDDLQPPDISKCSLEANSRVEESDSFRVEDPPDPESGQEVSQFSDIGDSGTDPGTIAGTGLGISFFRGYQHFIRPLIENKTNTFNNLEDADNEFTQIPEENQMNLDNISYNLNYHSSQDY